MNVQQKSLFCAVAVSVFASLAVWVGCTDNNVTGPDENYTLTVSANPPAGGSVSRDVAQAHYKAGASVTVTASAHPGYAFVGWAGASSSTDNSVTLTMDDNLTLIADFKYLSDSKKRFTVSFNTNGGSPDAISSAIVDSGSALGTQFPADPARMGYDFGGWLDGEVVYSMGTVIMKDVTLTALWTIKRFTVSFDANGGMPSVTNPVTVDSGSVLGAFFPANPARAGYDFSAWFDASTGETYTAQTAIAKNVTLMAEWTPAPTDIPNPPEGPTDIPNPPPEGPTDTVKTVKSFMVSFGTDGGSPSMISSVRVDSGKALGTSTNLPADPTKAGYVFGGWVDKVAGELYDADAIIVKDVKLTARWTPIEQAVAVKRFTVMFNANGGSPSAISSVTVDSGASMGADFPAGPTRMGHVFGGWFDGAVQYSSSTAITKNVMLTANWSTKKFTVSFDANGGIPSAIIFTTVDSGGLMGMNFPSNPAKAGYDFVGWFDAGTQYTYGSVIVMDVALKAKWEIKRYTVTFNANGGTLSATNAVTVDSGASIGANFPADPKWAGHIFAGWFGGTVEYTSGTVITKDVMLAAKWVAKQLTVKFDLNGGSAAAVPDSVLVDSGSALAGKLPEAPSSDLGYTFSGWYRGNMEYTSGTAITADITLKAMWGYVVSFNTNGGSPSTIPPVVVNLGGALGTPPKATKWGNPIGGWFDGITMYRENTVITRDITLTAQYQMSGSDKYEGRTINLGGRTWMAENLGVVVDSSSCYDGSDSNCVEYGRLYSWRAAKAGCNSIGWRLPTKDEWTSLVQDAGGVNVAGGRLKATTGWYDNSGVPSNTGTDFYRFTAKPGGERKVTGESYAFKISGVWWNLSEGDDPSQAHIRFIWASSDGIDGGGGLGNYISDKHTGYSVRCVKD